MPSHMEEQQNYDRVQQYVDGELSAAERLAFEQELGTDPALQKTYDDYLEAAAVVDQLAYEQLRQTIGDFKQGSLGQGPSGTRTRRLRFAAMAAAVLLLFSLAWWQVQKYTDEQLALQYFEAPNLSALRGQAAPLQAAVQAYQSEAYSKAIDLLQTELATSKDRNTTLYLLAHAYYQRELFPSAIDLFGEVVATQDPRYLENAQWHLALNYLRSGEESACRKILNDILANKQHGFRTVAQELLQKLDTVFRKIAS